MALLLFCFSLIWDWAEWYVFQSRLQINGLKWICVLHLQWFNSHNLSWIKHCPSICNRHTQILLHTYTTSETWHTSGVYYLSLYLCKKNIFAWSTRGSWDMLYFTLAGAITWPLVQHRGHSFSPYVVIFQGQPPRSGHLKPGWSGHFVCWACVITSLKSWGPGRELEYLSADGFKEQRARDSGHVLDSYARTTVQKGWLTDNNSKIWQFEQKT